MPYQAYAALKGLIEDKEGYWFRTLKTGHITDYFIDLKLRGLIEWINRLRKTREFDFFGSPSISIPMRRLLFFALAFLMVWLVLEFFSGVSTGRSLVYYLGYVLRGVVNG